MRFNLLCCFTAEREKAWGDEEPQPVSSPTPSKVGGKKKKKEKNQANEEANLSLDMERKETPKDRFLRELRERDRLEEQNWRLRGRFERRKPAKMKKAMCPSKAAQANLSYQRRWSMTGMEGERTLKYQPTVQNGGPYFERLKQSFEARDFQEAEERRKRLRSWFEHREDATMKSDPQLIVGSPENVWLHQRLCPLDDVEEMRLHLQARFQQRGRATQSCSELQRDKRLQP
ncbi:uncharacterized protein LOC134457120 [Engraulis encrasicolus]|uniref:uncharacterized protein LOC134457120 n=1 Tax=Engraulis encrasicolus TaxID=184585 RepID=UPI002FD072AA